MSNPDTTIFAVALYVLLAVIVGLLALAVVNVCEWWRDR